MNTKRDGNYVSISSTFYEQLFMPRSQKRKNSVKSSVSFYAFGICVHKSCAKNVDEIDTRTLVALVLHTIDRTPLHFAALNGHLLCVTHLVENESEIDAKDVDDITPLYLASKNDHLECVKYLVVKGANKSAKTHSGYAPEGIANYNRKTEVVKFLKKN